MNRKPRAILALAAMTLVLLLLASSCSFLISKEVTITNASAGWVTITCYEFLDGTTCDINPGGSVTKTVSADTTSIQIIESGIFYQGGSEVVELNASGSVSLHPDTAWIRVINDSGSVITSASIHGETFQYSADGSKTGTTISSGSESWVMIKTAFSSSRLVYVIGGSPYQSGIPYGSPKVGSYMTLKVKSTTEVEKLAVI